ncbi:MAG: DUF1559 domain-containing protein [Planctomycetota bacterium]
MKCPSTRRGFTLVELLVVIAIIGVLVSLLLPAVQSAREAARRASCLNNLKNVALAAINFHDQRGAFPVDEDYWSQSKSTDRGRDMIQDVDTAERTVSWVRRDTFPIPEEGLDGGGWIVRVLPYLEQQAIYDRFDIPDHGVNGEWYDRNRLGMNYTIDPDFRSAIETQPQVLVCPSNEFGGPRNDQWPYTDGGRVPFANELEVATTCYKGNAGDTAFAFQESFAPQPPGLYTYDPLFDCHTGNDCVGMLWRTTYMRGGVEMREVTDGASNTFLIGEASPVDGNSAAWSSDGDWAIASIELNWDWETSGACTNVGAAECWPRIRGFRSDHPGGAQFAMVDGSARFVQDEIEPLVYRALSTRRGGEVFSDN